MDNSEEVLRDLLDEIAIDNKLSNYDVKLKPISSGGANYTSQLFLATISDGSKRLHLFAKVISMGDKIRSQGYDNFFETEPFVFTKLSKMYRDIEEKHKVPGEHRFEFPKFYGHNPNRGQEALVLEDLSAQGYTVYDRFKSMDWPYAFKAVKEMAKLHALSFAFEHEYPEEFEKTRKILQFPVINQENMRDVMVNTLEAAYSVTTEKNKLRLQEFFAKRDFFMEFKELTKPLRRGVLVHGDFRMSNLMYKVDDEGIYQFKILDYQTMQPSSPVVDLLYFIITGTDEEFRAKHYFPLLDHYYSQLNVAMRRLELKPNEIYSREDFDFEIKMKLPHGIMLALFVIPTVLVEEKDAPKIDKEADFTTLQINKSGKQYPERINGIINDYVRWRIL